MSASAQAKTVFIVDDDEGLLILMTEALRAEGYEVFSAKSGAAALDWLRGNAADLMLLDLKLKDSAGPDLIQQLRRENITVPFVVVTGQGDEKVAVGVMKQGALDYVMKDTGLLDLLPAIVKRVFAAMERDRVLTALEKEIIEVSERERYRIGADLHDGLGQLLTAVELLWVTLKEDTLAVQPQLGKKFDQIGQFLRQAIAQTRALSRGLMPINDQPDALQTSLAELAEQTTALGKLQCRFKCPAPILFQNSATASHLYRIAQEAVNNAVKHSQAARVVISLTREKGVLRLQVSDDGTGLPKAKGRGMGLQVMKHRAGMIGAKLTVESKSDKGVIITCVLPKGA